MWDCRFAAFQPLLDRMRRRSAQGSHWRKHRWSSNISLAAKPI
jgi:hypothetical protein